jgi:hypothetical protein
MDARALLLWVLLAGGPATGTDYEVGRVTTLALFQARPSYETLRAMVKKQLTGHGRPTPAVRSPPASGPR